MQQDTLFEAEAFVKSDGPGVVFPDVQEWHLAAPVYSFHERAHEGGSVASAKMVRVGADGADFSVAGYAQPFTGHGRQTAPLANNEVGSQLPCAQAKWPRLSELREGEHFWRIRGSHLHDFACGKYRRRTDSSSAIFMNHLQQRPPRDDGPARRRRLG